MTIGHDALLSLVCKVNGTLALISIPFALYEASVKNSGVLDLKEKIALRRSQLLGTVVLDLVDKLIPYWPKTSSRIILDPNYEDDQPPSFSNDAIGEMKSCLDSHETTLNQAIRLRRICERVLAFDGYCYVLIFVVALESIAGLVLWLFWSSMTDRAAFALIALPVFTVVIALAFAAVRQRHIHNANLMIIAAED